MSEVSRGPPNELTPESWTPNFGVLHVQIQRHVQAGGRSYHCDGKHSYREVGLRFGLTIPWSAGGSTRPIAWLAHRGSRAITMLSSGYRSSNGCGRMACPVGRRQRCSTFAALAASRSGRGNMSAAGLKAWLRVQEAGPGPCPNHLSLRPGYEHRRGWTTK